MKKFKAFGNRSCRFYLLLSLIMFSAMIELAHGQRFVNRGYKLGVGIGPTFSQPYVLFNAYPGTSITPYGGFTIGPQVHYGFASGNCDNIAVRSGINLIYMRYGVKTENRQFGEIKDMVRAVTVEIPAIISVSSKVDDVLSIREFVGISLNLTDDFRKIDFQEGEVNESYYEYTHTVEVPESVAPKFVGGIGLEWKTKRRGFFNISLMYHAGFKDVIEGHIRYVINDLVYKYDIRYKGSYIGLEFQYFFRKVPILCPEFTR